MTTENKEIRNSRVSIALTEEMKEDLQLLARYKGISLNEILFRACEEVISNNAGEIERMKKI